jgi:hypothetical protein
MSATLHWVFGCLLAWACASHGGAQAPVPAGVNAKVAATGEVNAKAAAPVGAQAAATEQAPTLGHVAGRVMLRTFNAKGGARLEFPKTGRQLAAGEVLITGDQSLFELRVGEAGWWRVGRRAVVAPQAGGGGRLTAGTALVRVPKGASWRIDAARGSARLAAGLWLLQAVDNEGLKIACLDGPAELLAIGEPAAPESANTKATGGGELSGATAATGVTPEPLDRLKLNPGELVFLRPGGAAFGPIVVIYLEELIATSRLVNGFPEPLPELRRLQVLGVVQRQQLKGVTNALVAGARDDQGFEVAVPKAPTKPVATEKSPK